MKEGEPPSSLDREPTTTVSRKSFERTLEAIKLATKLSAVKEDEYITTNDTSEYSVAFYEGSDRPTILTISWRAAESFITLMIRDDYGPQRNQIAGEYYEMDEKGLTMKQRGVRNTELNVHTNRIDRLISQGAFRVKPREHHGH